MSVAAVRPHALTDAEYAALAGFLAQQAGLVFDQTRRPALAAIVGERIAATGAADLGAYLARISAPAGADERQRLLDEVTIPETHFFRNPPQMAALRRRLLPELMRRAVARGRALTVWSAGCSTGEEPYSLAMLAAEVAATLPEAPRVRIVATDLSSQAIAATRRARYQGRSLALVDQGVLDRWFAPQSDGSHEVVPAARDLVEVRLHNLVTDEPPFDRGEVDLVVCRNVTIYFARETLRDLVGRFHTVLGAGGYLVVGHAETLWQVTDAFTLVTLGDAFAYRKDLPSVPVPVVEPPAPVVHTAPRREVRRTPLQRARESWPEAPAKPHRSADSVPDPDHATELLRLAREALEQARYAEAARLAAAAAVASPFEVDAYVVEGRARATVGDDEGALVALRKAVYLAPKAGHARFQLAGALSRCGEHAGAAREYRAAAVALPQTDPAELHDLLDGCDVAQLVALCRRLADECDRRAAGEPA
ncbi:MAG: protein-glutamate O-methyltransferase CheR [Actinomycetales bacterium]|nr:protein-glutamate O-methyltransferase CheR [Actinomycetales bacterium]